jgi:hypothetical protein
VLPGSVGVAFFELARCVGSALRPCGARLTFEAAGTLAADHGGIAAYAGHNFYYAEVGSPEVGGATYR